MLTLVALLQEFQESEDAQREDVVLLQSDLRVLVTAALRAPAGELAVLPAMHACVCVPRLISCLWLVTSFA